MAKGPHDDVAPSLVANKSVDKEPKRVKVRREDGTIEETGLPPITDIELPETSTKSGLIRWLHGLGYEVKEIYVFLGIKYQMVRNIVTTEPKRAAREDTPELVITYKVQGDVIDDALDSALDQSLMAGRSARQKSDKEQRRADHLERADKAAEEE